MKSVALPIVLMLLTGGAAASISGQSASAPEVKYGVTVQPGPMDTLLLKDYAPASSLVVPRTQVAKARYSVIDVHTHSSMNRI